VADGCVGVLRADLVGGGFCAEAGIEATEAEAGAGLAAAVVNGEGVCRTTEQLTRGGVAPWGTFGWLGRRYVVILPSLRLPLAGGGAWV